MHSMVEGTSGPRNERGGSASHIRQNARSRIPQNPVPVFLDETIALQIAMRIVPRAVRCTVHCDEDPCTVAMKINHMRPDRIVPPELRCARPAAQFPPQRDIGLRYRSTQGTGACNFQARCNPGVPSTTLRAVPLPVPERTRASFPQPCNRGFTTLPPRVRRMASPISSSRMGRPCSLSQNAETKLNRLRA